jgi:hypothetical protein
MLPRSSAYYHLILSMVTCIPASKHRRPQPTHTIHLLFPFRRFPPPLKWSFFKKKSHFLLFVSRQIYHNYCIFFFGQGVENKGNCDEVLWEIVWGFSWFFIFFFLFSLLDFLGIILGAKRETRVLSTSVPKKMSVVSSIIRVCRVSRNGFQESLLSCPQILSHVP